MHTNKLAAHHANTHTHVYTYTHTHTCFIQQELKTTCCIWAQCGALALVLNRDRLIVDIAIFSYT